MSVHSKIQASRGTSRARVLMTGMLLTPVGNVKIVIRDISRSGAQVAIRDDIPNDCDVLFKRGPVYAAAHVAWVEDGEAGIRFYRELSPDEIEGTLPAALLRKGR